MRASRRLIEHLSGGVCRFRLTRNFGDDCSLQHVSEHEARVTMWRADTPRRVVHIADSDLPVFHVDLR